MTTPAPDLHCFRRSPAQVMRLARMGSAHPTRLSFLRALLRWMRREGWQFDRPVWQMDAKGVGRAVYRAIGPARTYSLVAFAHDLPDHMRSDRVIATAWDATFALVDGTPTEADLDRLAANVPLQEAGRISAGELTLSRANRSVRLFQHVVERLAAGLQPEAAELDAVGYLMRTTAVYGSGKFGAADRAVIADRPELAGPFRAEMLSVWLIRAFTVDLVEHIAAARGGAQAVQLDPALRRRLGVGNSTGLGMAPYLVRHPLLLNNWIAAREEALARVRAQSHASPDAVAGLHAALAAAQENAATWTSDHPIQQAKLADLRADLARIAAEVAPFPKGAAPWNSLWLWAEASLTLEGQEALLAMMLEPHGALIDDLAEEMGADEAAAFTLNGAIPIADFRTDFSARYAWALAQGYDTKEEMARFWYVSEEKLEPRIGARFTEEGAALEQPLGIGRLAAALARDLADWPGDQPLAAFLLAHPEHRLMARRVQQSAHHPYGEIQDNLLAADMLPIDILRCKLAFFGASHFDPRSDKWVRISLYKGEEFPDEMTAPARATPQALRRVPPASAPLSRNEVESLATKAARGAGFAWGLAEETGVAAGWLAAMGIDATAALLDLLQTPGAAPRALGQWEGATPLCPIRLGATLLDSVPLVDVVAVQVRAPILLIPFLARAARLGQAGLSVSWGGTLLGIAADGGFAGQIAAGLLACPNQTLTITRAAPQLANAAPDVLAALNAFAMRTTVPATEASRRGAGSANSDND